MSALLSADDLNDFISPGVACIKPIESLPKQETPENPYEVTTEDKVRPANPAPAQISLTDCLACSGCVTSAEAVLVSLQSHTEVLSTLDSSPSLDLHGLLLKGSNELPNGRSKTPRDGKLFIASVSPQVRASLAATYKISARKAGHLIDQLLSGPNGLRSGGRYNNGFAWVVDTNKMREACLALAVEEVVQSSAPDSPKRPILTSACPGWICYAEKTHPHVLPHLSRLKSPQALTGTLLKSVLSKVLNIHPSQIWHLALMPCFDKKLEASREELTNLSWAPQTASDAPPPQPVRDVDCVITTRELLILANARNISLLSLPLERLPRHTIPQFPDPHLSAFLFPRYPPPSPLPAAGTSGSYLHHILHSQQRLHPDSRILTTRGRNADVVDYVLLSPTSVPLFKCARYYGFRNIQNLVRKLKPPKLRSRLPGAAVMRGGVRRPGQASSTALARDALATEYAYVEVMACPGGCTNGGGQIRLGDLQAVHSETIETDLDTFGIAACTPKPGPQEQREWLARVDEAYFSASSSGTPGSEGDSDVIDGDETPDGSEIGHPPEGVSDDRTDYINAVLTYWSELTSTPLETLAYTTYCAVESDVGKNRPGGIGDIGTERVVEIASRAGGGW